MSIQLDVIQQCGFLTRLPEDIQIAFCKQAKLVSIPANTLLFDCGSSCVTLPLVTEGSIRVFKQSESGREISLYRVTSDQLCIVTLSCLLGGDNYPATGVTESSVTAITIPDALFHELIGKHRQFRDAVFHLFSERVSGLMGLVNEIAFHKLDQRLAQFLVMRQPIINGSHQQIADELGSVREIVSRLLKQFEENNWITLSRKQIEILDPEALEEYSSDVR
jgi:CRP/FNR family transcriptional regulator